MLVRCLRQTDTITAPAAGGQATAELEQGTTLTVTGLPEQDGLTLVIYPIPAGDTQAWSWFAGCMAPYGTKLYPLDIYFEDSDGNRVELSVTITITIETLRDYTDPIVCYVATDGTVEVLDSHTEGNTITFTTTHNSYYVLAERAAEPTPTPVPSGEPTPVPTATPASGGGSDSGSTATPAPTHSVTITQVQSTPAPTPVPTAAPATISQTGGESHPALWLVLLAVSALALGGVLRYRRKHQD